jgi:hypothetical protein
MAVKLTILKSGEQLISDIKEMISDNEKVIGYLLNNPMNVFEDDCNQDEILLQEEGDAPSNSQDIDVVMTKWIRLSKTKDVMIPVDWVVTVVDPLDSLVEMYNSFSETNDSMPTDKESGPSFDLQG